MDIYGYGYFPPPHENEARATPQRAIFYDVACGNADYIPHLLDSHDELSPNIRNASGETPLMFAVKNTPKKDRLAVVETLASRLDVLVNFPDDRGRTPLHEAILNDDPETVRALLYWHADLYAKDSEGQTPLDLLKGADCPDLRENILNRPMNFLLMQGKNGVFSDLKTAAQHVPTVNELPTLRSKRDKLLQKFSVACAKRNLSGISKVVNDPDFDIHHDDNLALRQACFFGHHAIVEYLLDCGPDVHARNDEPLHHLINNNNYFLVKMMLASGADPVPRRQEYRKMDHVSDDIMDLIEDCVLEQNCSGLYDQDKLFSRRLKPSWGEKMSFNTKAKPALKKKETYKLKEIFFDACRRNKPWTAHQILKQSDIETQELLQQGLRQATLNDARTGKSYRNKDIVHVLLEHKIDAQSAANSFYDAYFTDNMSTKPTVIKNAKAIMSLLEQFGACRQTARDRYFNIEKPEDDNATPQIPPSKRPQKKGGNPNPFRPSH